MKFEQRKKKTKHHGDVIMKRIMVGLLTLAVLLMAALVIYALKLGVNIPAASNGIVVTTEPLPETEPPTEPTGESTEPASESETEPTELDPDLEKAAAFLENMSLEEKVGQLIFASADSLTGVNGADIAGGMTQEALKNYPVGGIVYFSQNIRNANQITEMVSKSQEYANIPLFIGVDEEGGRVSRLSSVGITDRVDPMATYGEAGSTEAVEALGQTLGSQMKEAGFNLDFAPVADVITNPNNREIGDRSFSTEPEVASQMVAAMTKGLQGSGVSACLKHFPGHGSTEADSHSGMSVSQRTMEELRETEFLPFRAGIEAGVGMVMISHMSLPQVTGDNTPCDLSEAVVTELLRQELGYEGVIITDSHEMGAITEYYTSAEAAVLAIQAGCDVVLMPLSVSQAYEALLQAVEDGTLTEERINESVLRVLTLKYRLGLME